MPSVHLLSIGELAERTGVATSALRYYEECGLIQPAERESGRRRYLPSAVSEVGLIVLLRDVGFTLAEIGSLVGSVGRRSWKKLVDGKLSEIAAQQRRLDVARAALEHSRRCPSGEPLGCPRLWSIVEGHLGGRSLEESHASLHRA
jgi:DNA-binding transcriptional MerR regulator